MAEAVAGLMSRRPRFDPGPVNMRCMVDKVAVVQSSHVGSIPPVLHAHLQVCATFTRRSNGRDLETIKKQC
jgi:hypothetical protein